MRQKLCEVKGISSDNRSLQSFPLCRFILPALVTEGRDRKGWTVYLAGRSLQSLRSAYGQPFLVRGSWSPEGRAPPRMIRDWWWVIHSRPFPSIPLRGRDWEWITRLSLLSFTQGDRKWAAWGVTVHFRRSFTLRAPAAGRSGWRVKRATMKWTTIAIRSPPVPCLYVYRRRAYDGTDFIVTVRSGLEEP